MIALVLAAAVTSPPIDTLGNVAKQLALQIGKPIQVSPYLKNDLIFVEPRGLSGTDLLSALATAVHFDKRARPGTLQRSHGRVTSWSLPTWMPASCSRGSST